MKKLTFFLIFSMVIVLSAEAHRYRSRNANITISIQTFYDQLSPYGDWIYTTDNGYVWRPYFDNPESFRPYSSGGNWVYTNYGWTWNSNYEWGWAAFHYGRWNFDNYLGWTWIPGYEWAPAWVSWGSYDDCWGWAPMGPNIYVQSNWFAPDPWWTFVPRNHFCSGDWSRYIYNRPVRVTNITYINNVYNDNRHSDRDHNSWYHGPQVRDVERYSRNTVRTMEIVENHRAGSTGIHNNRLNVYRPEVDNKRSDYRPTEFRNAEQARYGKRQEQTNPRSNNPGNNRYRIGEDSRSDNNRVTIPDNKNVNREHKSDNRAVNQSTSGRNQDMRNDPYIKQNPNQRQDSRNRDNGSEKGKETRMAPQIYPGRNSSRQQSEAGRETPERKYNNGATDRNQSTSYPSRTESPNTRQPQSSSPDLNKVYSNTPRESGNRETPSARPTREQRPQNSTPASTSKTENTERRQTRNVETNRQENKRQIENNERGTSGNPNRR